MKVFSFEDNWRFPVVTMHWKWNKIGKANLWQKDSVKNKLWPFQLKFNFLQNAGNFLSANWQKEINWEKLSLCKHFLIKNNREIKRMIIHFLILLYITVIANVFLQIKSNGPNNCKHEISDSLHFSILFILFCYTKLHTDPHVNKDFFLFKCFSKDSSSCSKVGFTHV